jgi:hypothetical protein
MNDFEKIIAEADPKYFEWLYRGALVFGMFALGAGIIVECVA